jgi:HSP20 family protein
MSSQITRITTCVVLAALTAVVGVQSYYLYRVHTLLDQRAAPAAESALDTLTGKAPMSVAHPSPAPAATPSDPFDWDPLQEMQAMRSRIDSLFADSLDRFALLPEISTPLVPPVDLTDDGDEYVVRVDVPGAEESDFAVTLEDQSLKIQGDHSEEVQSDEPGQGSSTERRVSHFERQLALPGPVQSDSLMSHYADGVLTIRIHKA